MRLRLVLLGAGNALGQAIIREGAEYDIAFLAPRPPQGVWTPASLTELIDEVRPDVVINLAYYFDWFQLGRTLPEKFLAQEQAVEHLAQLCQHYGSILLQPSSYRVFDGFRATAYNEEHECHPLSPRGQALVRMEQSVRSLCPQHVILRFGWLLDDSLEGMLGRVLQRASAGEELEMADDRRGNPTPVEEAARAIVAVLKQLDCTAPLWGTYHFGGQEAATTLTVSEAILHEAKYWNSSIGQELVARPHASFEDASIEPQHGVLDCKKITHTFGIKPRAWRNGIADLLDSYYRMLDRTQ